MRHVAILTLILLAATAAFAQKNKNEKNAGPGPKSQAELQAVQAMLQAQTQPPDARIQACENVITKFPSSDFKPYALYTEAEAWQQKGDYAKAIVYGEQTLMADPKSYDAQVLLANVLAATTKDTDLDMAEKLTRAEKYAHDALENLETAQKPALFQLTDETWDKLKRGKQGEAWQALGTCALVRKNTDEAITDYKKGADIDPDPLLMIRTGRALLAAKKPDEAITWYDKALAAPGLTDQLKNIATNDKARALQAKGGTAPKP
jgi:tetratricopeptide (TPR) repeat protein